MKRFRREISIDIVIRGIFKNNQITIIPRYTLISKTGIGLPKTGVMFYTVYAKKLLRAQKFYFYRLKYYFQQNRNSSGVIWLS